MDNMFLLTSSAPDAQQRITEFCTAETLAISNWLSEDGCSAQAVLATAWCPISVTVKTGRNTPRH